jgi:predicted  nucleic acid-binding Zn-ribbon protein
MRLVSAAKYAALQTLQQRTATALEKSEKQAAERQATITRQAAELDRLRDTHPDTPLPQPPSPQGDVELRRQLSLARRAIRELAQQIDGLQTSHVADTRELHDLRQNGGRP